MRTGPRVVTLVACGLLLSAEARAQQESAPGAQYAGPQVSSRMRVGLDLVPMPFGTLKASLTTPGGLTLNASTDAAFAFGLMPFFDYLVTPNFFIGFGPTYTFNVKASEGGGTAAKELDLLVRVGGQAPVSDAIQLYGYVAPGYSWIIPSSGDSAKGAVLGLHAGAMFAVSPTAFLNAQIGYQIGYQTVTLAGRDIDLRSNYLQIALGGGLVL